MSTDSSLLIESPDLSSPLAGFSAEQRQRLTLVLERYLTAQEQGTPLVKQEIFDANPDLAPALEVYFRGIEDLHALAAGCAGGVGGNNLSPAVIRGDTKRFGDFELISEIGRGGMGVVYEARQISLDRRVAVKVLPFAAVLDARQIARFEHEAQAAAQLHHPHIVPVFAIGIERGVHYYAMQLIDGQPLDQAIRERRGAPHAGRSSLLASKNRSDYFRTVIGLGLQAAEALHAAHEYGIIHRDIKPSNLLLDTGGKLWVADFGLARFEREGTLTRTGDLVGTIRYMSPEQAAGQGALVDQRTDIYSLGITLYELLCLQPAFADAGGPILLRQIERDEPLAPRQIRPEIPRELETVIFKAIAKERDQRYATAQQFADDLRCLLEGKSTLAKPTTVIDRARRWSKRNHRMVGFAVAAMALTTLGLSVSNVLITQEKARTEQNAARAEQYFRDARDVLDRFGITLAERLADLPEAQAVSRELLNETRAYYERFIEDARQNPALRAEMALTYGKLAMLVDRVGAAAESLAIHEQALAVFEELAAADRKNVDYLRHLALAHNNCALALARVGRVEEAERLFEKAVEQQRQLHSQSPRDAAMAADLASSLANLGLLQAALGNTDESRISLQSSLELLRHSQEAQPTSGDLMLALASAYGKLASTFLDQAPTKAVELHQEAHRLLSQVSAASPDDLPLRRDLALAANNLAAAYSRLKHLPEALAHYQQAIEIQENLLRHAPTSAAYRRELAISENNSGLIYSRLGDGERAQSAFRRSIELQESLSHQSPTDLTLRSNLAGAYHNLGVVLEKHGDSKAAAECAARAIEHQQFAATAAPQVARYRQLLSTHLASQTRASTQTEASPDQEVTP